MKPCVPNKLPLKTIAWEPLIPLIGKVNRALAYYDGILYGLSNPDVLLSPLTTQEAVFSSKIEGAQATLEEVLRYEAGEAPRQETRRLDIEEIMNYRHAMRLAETELQKRPFSLNLLKELHAVLLTGVRGRDKARGQFRTTQNWIGAPGSPIEDAQFVPPDPKSMMEYLDNWEKYYHLDEPDALVHLAIIHAQFEIIHPFLDGNGRLGRMIIPLFLHEKRLLSRPMFYISAYLEEHRDIYVERLRTLCVEPDAWNRWIEFFLSALYEQSQANAAKARQIIDLYERLKTRAIDITHSQFAVLVLDQIFKQPVFPSNILFHLPGMPTKPAVQFLLNKLKSAGILKVLREGSGRRPQVLAFAELVNLCEGKEVM
ncbi:MAG: Fic/DOC family N-terminal domain-containing protein [Dehalococcoidia bacterium]|nr:Fic/DOC family N-terminal domain-containing protein [Dehalococcoidia bacterium]